MLRSYARQADLPVPTETAFALLADLRGELRWNPDARSVRLLTPGPIRVGSRFEARWRGTGTAVVTVTRHEPCWRWASVSRAIGLLVTTEGELDPVPGGCRYTVRIAVAAQGLARALAPIAVRMMARREDRNLVLIRAALAAGGEPPATSVRGPGTEPSRARACRAR